MFGSSTESAQGGLGRTLGAEAISSAELRPGSPGAPTVGSGLCCKHPPDPSELGRRWPHRPSHTCVKENHGDSIRSGVAACRGRGGWLPPAPRGSSFASRILHLLSCHPLHQSAQRQEAVAELSAGSKRLRKQVRRNWSRTESRWRAGSHRQAEGCQEESARNAGSALFCLRPGWPPPCQAQPLLQPAPHVLRLNLPTLPRGAARGEAVPGTGVGSPEPAS